MKKLLLILFALICSKGFGQTASFNGIGWAKAQEITTAVSRNDTVILGWQPLPRVVTGGNVSWYYASSKIVDTIRVIMLCADTVYTNTLCFWKYGYAVHVHHWEAGDYQILNNLEHVKYIDIDKKEMPKNIIVWDSKEIKQ